VEEQKLEALRKHFKRFDVDSSGFIDAAELSVVLRNLGFNPSDDRVAEILNAYDTDQNGNLSFGEFVEVLHTHKDLLRVCEPGSVLSC
jgi:Ca2+-binding EF-hand superfamily protein